MRCAAYRFVCNSKIGEQFASNLEILTDKMSSWHGRLRVPVRDAVVVCREHG
jgi:hypothetical protein